MTYNPGVPTGLVPLKQDYQNLQTNFQQLDTVYGIDHYAFSNTTSGTIGYHKVVHMVSFSTITSNPPNNYPPAIPSNVGLTGELFTTQSNDGYQTDEILWYQSGGGRLSQLTSNFVSTKGTAVGDSGRTFLAGGITMIWGSFLTGAPPLDVNFPFGGFLKECINLQISPATISSSSFSSSILNGSIDKTGFTWLGSGSVRTVFYLAIGN